MILKTKQRIMNRFNVVSLLTKKQHKTNTEKQPKGDLQGMENLN